MDLAVCKLTCLSNLLFCNVTVVRHLMEFNLNAVDFIQVGVTSPRTLKLLPSSSNKHTQKIAVGDHNGILHCFSVKRGDINYAFKTLPGPKITSLCLGGVLGAAQDKIFIASNNEVQGYNKKGKQFLRFDTNLTESIQEMFVAGSDLMVCGNFVYNHFVECHDTNYFLANDKINDIICLPRDKVQNMMPVLACNDRVLRILKDSQLLYEVDTPGPVSSVTLSHGDGGDEGEEVLFGTLDGKIGSVSLGRSTFTQQWLIGHPKTHGGILCFENYDIFDDGVKDLIVGKDDGQIEIYSYNEGDAPVLKYSHTSNESVTSVQGGIVSNSSFKEIVAATYSGWVLGLTTEPIDKLQGLHSSAHNLSEEAKQKIVLLRIELEELQQKISLEKDRFQKAIQDKRGVAVTASLNINDKFCLCQEDASYLLTLETLTAIDHLLLQSNIPLDLVDVEKNSAVVSFSKCDAEAGNFLLATYRCQANTTRLEVKIRTIEGQYGILQVYVTPRLQPKCCAIRQYQIKPLSLHQRIRSCEETGPLNSLTLQGPFSLAEIHSWVVYCLPELPERPPAEGIAKFTYISTFLHTKLHCCYKKGEAIFRSENLSTISILKDVLTKQATKRKIRFEISCDINEDSIEHTLKLIHPFLEYQLQLARKVQLVEPLKELQLHEGNTNFLTPEYDEILHKSSELLDEYNKQPSRLERLYGMITDLYIDKFKFKGINVKSRIPALLELLHNYNLQSLIEFFNSSG